MELASQAAQAGTPWQHQDDILIQTAIRNNHDFDQICALFPARSSNAVRHRISRAHRIIHIADSRRNRQTANTVGSNLRKAAENQSNSGRLWTTEELESLHDAILHGHDLAHIRTLFPERSADAVRCRYNRTLQEHCSHTASKPVALLWSAEDDQKLQDAVRADIDRDEICAMFPSRSVEAVATRIRKVKKVLENKGPGPEAVSTPVDRGNGVHPDQDQSKPDDQSVRSLNPSKVDHDYIIGPVPENEQFMMSGALPVGEISHSPDPPPHIVISKAGAVQGLPRSSTPPTPAVELLTRPPRAQEPPVVGDWEYTFGDASYESYLEGSGVSNNYTWSRIAGPHKVDGGWDVDSGILPDARTRVETGALPENHPAGIASQEQRSHSVLPTGGLTSTYHPIRPYPPYLPTTDRVDNGYGKYILSMDEHPDLHDGLDFTPTPHHPITPPNFVTSEQLFADPSIKPSVFMDVTPSTTDEELLRMFRNYPPNANEEMAQSDDVVADGDMMEE